MNYQKINLSKLLAIPLIALGTPTSTGLTTQVTKHQGLN